jgi:hypothetical protein
MRNYSREFERRRRQQERREKREFRRLAGRARKLLVESSGVPESV